jgi:putative transcriptional regulator
MLGGENMDQKREKLINLRKKANLLQKDVVKKLSDNYQIKITESYYGMIEQGVRTPKLEIALALANLFEVRPDEIFFRQTHNKNLGNRTA